MALQFFEKNEEAQVGHALRIEDPVEMVAFVLHDAGVTDAMTRLHDAFF